MSTQSQEIEPRQPKALLVDDRLRRECGEGVIAAVDRLRERGHTWTSIAERLSEWTGVAVSRQLLRLWHDAWTADREGDAA